MNRAIIVLIVVILSIPSVSWSLATTMEVGVRGVAGEVGVHENYSGAELYFLKELPWKKEVSPGFMVYARLDAGVGYLHANDDDGGWLAAGGDVVLSMFDGSWEVEAGWRPTLLSDNRFGSDDFGGPLQFSSHVGTTFYLGDVGVSYRFVHISNAGIYDDNPGLDLHLVGLGMRF